MYLVWLLIFNGRKLQRLVKKKRGAPRAVENAEYQPTNAYDEKQSKPGFSKIKTDKKPSIGGISGAWRRSRPQHSNE